MLTLQLLLTADGLAVDAIELATDAGPTGEDHRDFRDLDLDRASCWQRWCVLGLIVFNVLLEFGAITRILQGADCLIDCLTLGFVAIGLHIEYCEFT